MLRHQVTTRRYRFATEDDALGFGIACEAAAIPVEVAPVSGEFVVTVQDFNRQNFATVAASAKENHGQLMT